MSNEAHTIKWGILACGWISTMFTTDLLSDPSTRQVNDVIHQVVAVASRDKSKVGPFLDQCWKDAGVTERKDNVRQYGSYEELYQDQDVDCIYIGTPHSHHYQNVHDALSAGKNVLCEKPFTINAKQTKILIDLARSKDLFLMEAVWTRFQPFATKLSSLLESKAIGPIQLVQSELNSNFAPTALKNPSHRLVNPVLGGGALLDVGPYPWTQLVSALLPFLESGRENLNEGQIFEVKSSMTKLKTTGVDATVVASIKFPVEDEEGKRDVLGVMTTSQIVQTSPNRCTLVQGTKGFIEVNGPAYRPTSMTYSSWDSPESFGDNPDSPTKTETFEFSPLPGGIGGYAFQADEVARCLRDGKKESDRMRLKETLLMMMTFDEIRRQGNFRYPDELETTDLKN